MGRKKKKSSNYVVELSEESSANQTGEHSEANRTRTDGSSRVGLGSGRRVGAGSGARGVSGGRRGASGGRAGGAATTADRIDGSGGRNTAGTRASYDVDNGAVLSGARAVLDLDVDGLRLKVNIPGQGGARLLREGLECWSSNLAARDDTGEVRGHSARPRKLSRFALSDGRWSVDGELRKSGGGEGEDDGKGLHGCW